MREALKSVSHQQVLTLLHNKCVVVLGDSSEYYVHTEDKHPNHVLFWSSVQRSVYKDLVLLLQKDKYLTPRQLRHKGEMCFEQDCLVEGGCLSSLHNGTEYREVRQYQTDRHLVRFYFVTRVYSSYMKSILNHLHCGPKPDVLIVNSCVWDISRYGCEWTEDYKKDLQQFFHELRRVLPMETLVIWNVTMPLAEKIKGGFLVSEIEHRMAHLRSDVIEANYFSGTLADRYGLDVLDLHFHFRLSLQHRAKDGVHWNAIAHRRISWLLLQHMAHAWGVTLAPVWITQTLQRSVHIHPSERSSVHSHSSMRSSVHIHPSVRNRHTGMTGHTEWSRSRLRPDPLEERHLSVMTRRRRHHYAPYSQRPGPYHTHQGYYYY